MYLGRPTAGKTGTTNDFQALWFAGYTPNMAAAVWTGHPNAPSKNPMANVTIKGVYYTTLAGSSLPGPIWETAMLGAVADLPVEYFVPIDPEVIDGAQVTLPSLTGLSPAAAIKRLDRLGLTVDVASYNVASYEPEGTVAYSSPGGGYIVQPGDTVTLYLSSGEPPAPEPTPTKTKKQNGGNSGGGGGNAGGNGNNGGNSGGGGGNAGGNGNN